MPIDPDDDLFDAPAPVKRSNKIVHQPAGASWSLDRLPEVESAYQTAFKKRLPLANKGQGSIHRKWNYDHTNSADVSINPSSPEGKQFEAKLREMGVPFLAFTGAIPGVATGPHFHLGFPSRKTDKKFNVGAQRRKQSVASDDLFDADSDLFDQVQGQTPPPKTPRNAVSRQPSPTPQVIQKAQSVPANRLSQLSVGGVQGRTSSVGVGDLRRIDDPATQQINRIQRAVTSEQSSIERQTKRAPGTANARLLEPKLTENEEVLRRLEEEQSLAKREQEAAKERQRVARQFTAGDKAEIADFVNHLKGKGTTYTGIRAGARSVGASTLYKLAGLTDLVGPSQVYGGKPEDNPLGEFLRRKALAGELSVEDIPPEQRGQVAEFLTQMGLGLAEIAVTPGGPVTKFAGLAGTESIGRGQSAREVAKETAKGATIGQVFKSAGRMSRPAETVQGRAANLAKEGAAIGAGTYATEVGFGAPSEDAALSAATNVALHGALGAKRLRGQRNVEAPDRSTEDVRPARATVEEAVPPTVESVGGRPPELETPQRFQHIQFGEVEVVPDQSGARPGRLKVAEVADLSKQHFVKKSDMQGRGNARMIPLKPEGEVGTELSVPPVESRKVDRPAIAGERLNQDMLTRIREHRQYGGSEGTVGELLKDKREARQFRTIANVPIIVDPGLPSGMPARTVKLTDAQMKADGESSAIQIHVRPDATVEHIYHEIIHADRSAKGRPSEHGVTWPHPEEHRAIMGGMHFANKGKPSTSDVFNNPERGTIARGEPKESVVATPTAEGAAKEGAALGGSAAPNIPERPETIQAQLESRGYSLIPNDTPRPSLPQGYRAEKTADGVVYYDPRRIDAEAIRSTPTTELLGHVEPKSERTTEAVVARTPEGTELHSSAVSPENLQKQVEVTRQNFPEAKVEAGGPEVAERVLEERVAHRETIPLEQLTRAELKQRVRQGGARQQEYQAELSRRYLNRSLSQFVRDSGGIAPGSMYVGEVARLSPKETNTTGLLNKNNRVGNHRYVAEYMMDAANEAGYRDAKGARFEHVGDFLEAVESDAIGRRKHLTQEAYNEYDYEGEYRKRAEKEAADEVSAEALITLLEHPERGILYDKVVEGNATEFEAKQFREQAVAAGVSARDIDAIEFEGTLNRSAQTEPLSDTPQRPQAREVATPFQVFRPEPSTTSARKDMMAADRAELDLPQLPQAERKSWQSTLDTAKEKGTQRASLLADEVLNKPRSLNEVETAQLVLRAQEVKNDHSRLMKEIGDEKIPESIASKRAEIEALEREFDKLTQATKASGTEKGRALASQKLTINQDYDLVSLIARAKAAKGRELEPEERTRYEGMAKEIESLTERLSKAEEELTSKRLQKEIDRVVRRGKRAESKKELDDEFAMLAQQFAQARAQSKGIHSAGLAGLDPEGIYTPLIAKMAKNRVRAGVIKAEEVVDHVYEALEGNFSKRDIRDAISGYGLERKGKPRSEDVKELARIKSELKKLSAQEDIEAGVRLSPAEKTRQTNLLKQEADLTRRLEEKDFERPERRYLTYNKQTQALESRVSKLKSQYERELYLAQRGTLGAAWDIGVNVANVPKSLKSMGDVSAVLRQGGYFSITHPVLSTKAGIDMVRSFSETGFKNVEREITNHGDFDLAKRSGVEFTGMEKDNPNLSKREEAFLGADIIDQAAEIPIAGKAVKPIKAVKDFSERTFVSFLDSQRMQVFSRFADHVRSLKMPPKEEAKALKAMGQFVNIGTGRGSLGKSGNQIAPALNVLMFSPRLLASRVQLMNKMVNPVAIKRMPKGARSLMIKDNVKFAGTIATALGLAKAAGAGVSLDPDDADFLKIRIGNSRYDILTGLQQPMRFIYRMARAVQADVTSDETYAGETKSKLLERFARSKAAPVAGGVTDYITGEDFKGRKFKLSRQLVDLVTPLYLNDFKEAMEEDGVVGALVKTSPALVGIGAQTYNDAPEKPGTHAEKLARKFVRAKMPDNGREEEQIDIDQTKADLKAKSRRGEDVTKELESLGAKITSRQAKGILDARNKTRLQEDVNRLSALDAIIVWSVMNPGQQQETKSILERKASLIDNLPVDQQENVRRRYQEAGIQAVARKPSTRVTGFKKAFTRQFATAP